MSFTFLHTADWQIGKAFAGMPADVAAALGEARLSAIDRLATVAVGAGARYVLVAGDVFDAETLAPKTLRQALSRMARHAGLTWHLLPGNHDPLRPAGLWERLKRDGLPGNVRLILEPRPIEIESGVWLLPAPLTGRATGSDPTAYMDGAATPPEALRIGLAHGSVRGFGSSGTAAVGIGLTRAESARLDYLALGDWHGAQEVAPRTWYSGTPEPDRFLGNEPGHALIVRLAQGGAMPVVTRLPTAQFHWRQVRLDIAGSEDLSNLEASLSGPDLEANTVLLQLALVGRVSAAGRQEVLKRLRTLEAGLRHLEADLSRLTLRAAPGGLDALGEAGDLRCIGERLTALATGPVPEEAAVATEALGLLLDLAGEARGAGA